MAVLIERIECVGCVFEWKGCDGWRMCMNELVYPMEVCVSRYKGGGSGLARLDCYCCGEQCVSDEASGAC